MKPFQFGLKLALAVADDGQAPPGGEFPLDALDQQRAERIVEVRDQHADGRAGRGPPPARRDENTAAPPADNQAVGFQPPQRLVERALADAERAHQAAHRGQPFARLPAAELPLKAFGKDRVLGKVRVGTGGRRQMQGGASCH